MTDIGKPGTPLPWRAETPAARGAWFTLGQFRSIRKLFAALAQDTRS